MKKSDHHCDFCNKSKDEVEKLIVGDNAAICNDCVDLCIDILKDEKVKTVNTGEQFDIVVPLNIYFKMNALDTNQSGLNYQYINLNLYELQIIF